MKQLITIEGFDKLFVTGIMEVIECITADLISMGFTQMKDRPNAYIRDIGINAPLENAFDDDKKITFQGIPISQESAEKIIAIAIDEVWRNLNANEAFKRLLKSAEFLHKLTLAGFGDEDEFPVLYSLKIENDLGVKIYTLLEDAGWSKRQIVKFSPGLRLNRTFIHWSHPDIKFSLIYQDEKEYTEQGNEGLPEVTFG